ncbi:MAG: DNA repair protein RadA [Alphaproteobacteria bacterium]|nr:DNA repair protein RadA [Alphaproteobacteria bacterium]NCB50051.1 DNA repair protein RadA [Alphaproteobacteria bacterium]
MSKKTSQFVCQNCGATFPRWVGKCDSCGEWGTVQEEALPEREGSRFKNTKDGRTIAFTHLKGSPRHFFRLKSDIEEFDRVCGGGLVRGSVILVGGDPGIGKSTLLLQASAKLTSKKNAEDKIASVAYFSGEESVDQIRMRAERLKVSEAPLNLASTINVRDILTTLDKMEQIDVAVIDSIQTMYMEELDSAPGTVSQVRSCAHELIRLAKKKGFVLFLVGHVTKEGTLAGPRILEHMVDTVLYFEGDRGHHFRILRAVKNRFGATDEIGVFEMTEQGLMEVPNPSALFLAERRGNISGSCVFAGIEGSRPMLVEIQALLSQPVGSYPKRAVVGWDMNRLSMVLAVLESRCGLVIGQKDIFLNVAGGMKISEPAADLAVAAALISAFTGKPVPPQSVLFGEIGLSGEIRAVAQSDLRLKESEKLGFTEALVPRILSKTKKELHLSSLKKKEIGNLRTLVELFKGASNA